MPRHLTEDDRDDLGGGGGGSGQVLQVVTATSTVDDTTSSSTLVDSSLSAAITPTAADSTLVVEVHGTVTNHAVGGTPVRESPVAIYNSTDATLLVEQLRGRRLIAGSTAEAAGYNAIALRATYTVDSTTERTFVLQHSRGGSSSNRSTILGTETGGVLMTIWEISA